MADPILIQAAKQALPLQRPHSQPLIRPYPLLNGCVLALLPVRGDKWHDFSPQENHGAFNGDAGFTSKGRFGPGVYFDGTGDYVDCGSDASLDITDETTIEFWVNFDSFNAGMDYYKGNAYYGYGTNTYWLGYFYMGGSPKYSQADISLNTDTWYHFAITYDGTSIDIFIDGNEVTYAAGKHYTSGGDLDTSGSILTIGHVTGAVINGTMDEFKIWNRALSKDEIKYLYELGKPY